MPVLAGLDFLSGIGGIFLRKNCIRCILKNEQAL